MKPLFDYIIEQLNLAEGLTYRGNYIFKFFEDKMTVYDPIEGTLVNDEIEYSPVAILSKTPVTFVEKNQRVDWLVEIGIAVRIEGDEYDASTDLDYANIQSVIDDIQGSSLTLSGKKYSVKVDKEPNYQGYNILGNSKYAILTVVLNVTEMISGYFGQDWTVEVDDAEVDFTDISITTTKRFYTADDKSALDNDYNKPIGRATVIELTMNYDDETTLLAEVMASAGLKTNHTIDMTLGETTWDYDVTVESAPMSLTKGGVMQITLRFLEV